MRFTKYIHLENFGNASVQGIDAGICHIFPKLDGTNASVWLEDDMVCAGSRNRKLSVGNDNAGFYNWVLQEENHEKFLNFLREHPDYVVYGEWMVPHSLKTYQDDVWRTFKAFDVYSHDIESYLPYEKFAEDLNKAGVEVIPPIAIVKNPSYEDLQKCLEKNVYYIKDGQGVGEGIAIKNYSFVNRFGETTWAKLITNSFKLRHVSTMGAPIIGGQMLEEKIVNEHVTDHLVNKVFNKIVVEMDGWEKKYVPRLLSTVFFDLINEEMYDIVKNNKMPTINFRTLNTLAIQKIKEIRKDLF